MGTPLRAGTPKFDDITTTVGQDDGPTNIAVLYLGNPMSGKTEAAISWPDPWVINWDPNDGTLKKHPGLKVVDMWDSDRFGGQSGIQAHESIILPLLEKRNIPARTIVFDSYSMFSDAYVNHLKGRRDKMEIAQWGLLLHRLQMTLKALMDCKKPKSGHPGYHIVITAHLKEVYDDSGNTVAFGPAIDGQFKDRLPRSMDCMFFTESKSVRSVGKDNQVVTDNEYVIHTVPPDRLHLAGDRIGGGRYKKLPARMSGLYPALAAAWGLDEE